MRSLVGLAAVAAAVTPVQKVVQLLQNMKLQAQQEKKDEEVSYSAFAQFCTDTEARHKSSIIELGEEIDAQSAAHEKAAADAAALGDRYAQLQANVGQWQADRASAQKERATERADFTAEHQDYSESVDALERAISTLKAQSFDRKQLMSDEDVALIQAAAETSTRFSTSQRASLRRALEEPDYLSRSAPEGNAYEFQSGGIVDMLERLRDDFDEKKGQAEAEELNARHAHEMLTQDLVDSIEEAETESADTEARKAKKEQAAGLAKKLHAQANAAHGEESHALSDLKAECAEKGRSFTEKQQLRGDEIEAIATAVAILSDSTVAGAEEKHFSLAQLRSTVHSSAAPSEAQARVAVLLEGLADKYHQAPALAALAMHARGDPFEKVKLMVRDMISRLLEEGHAEAEHHGFCTKEIAVSKKTRAKLQSRMDKLDAEHAEQQATEARLKAEVATLTEQSAALQKAVAEASALRATEHGKNKETVKDAAEAQTAVAQAVAVLQQFYAAAGKATAFVQVPVSSSHWDSLADPTAKSAAGYGQRSEDKVDLGHISGEQTFGATYKGAQEQAGGVLAMLEVISSDFARLEAQTNASEEQAQASHAQFLADSKMDLSVKAKSVELKTGDAQTAASAASQALRDWKLTEEEHIAAEAYWDRLKPQCIKPVPTFEERHEAREEQIASLKEALQILSTETA